MKVHKKILCCIVIILATITNITNAREEWVDPHDMNIRMEPRSKKENIDKEGQTFCNCNNNFYKDRSSSHLKKVISLITDMTHFDRRSDIYKGIIDIHLNTSDYDFLKKFVSAELIDEHVLRQLSAVLDKSLEKSFYSTYFFTFGEYIYLTIFNGNILLSLGLLVFLYVLWRIQPHNYKLTTLFKLFFPLVYISDFYLRYRAKLEEVEIDKYLHFENYKVCDPNNLGWFEWIYDKYTGNCQNNKKNFLLSQRSSFHLFTPLSVISEQFDVFVTILKHLGTGFGLFMWALIEQGPWYTKPILGIFGFLLVVIMMLMLGSYVLGVSPKFNLFHLLHFEVSHRETYKGINSPTRQDCLSGENLKNLLKSGNRDDPGMLQSASSYQRKISSLTFKTKPKFIPGKKTSTKLNINDEKDLEIFQKKKNESEIDKKNI